VHCVEAAERFAVRPAIHRLLKLLERAGVGIGKLVRTRDSPLSTGSNGRTSLLCPVSAIIFGNRSNWVMRSGVLFWAVGGGYTGAAGLADIPSKHALLIQFDRRNRVRRFESVVRPPLKPYGDFHKEWVKG
jgi:hypothetical protein